MVRVQFQDAYDKTHEMNVKVLNCDTISQVKEKILDAFFKGFSYSKRPLIEDLDLVYIPSEWSKSTHGRLILHDEDKTSKIDCDNFKRLNTLAHYKITNGALLLLLHRQSYQTNQSSIEQCNSFSLDNKNSGN
jgi:plexin A